MKNKKEKKKYQSCNIDRVEFFRLQQTLVFITNEHVIVYLLLSFYITTSDIEIKKNYILILLDY